MSGGGLRLIAFLVLVAIVWVVAYGAWTGPETPTPGTAATAGG
ncbi:MAG: hypothetical protein AAFW69_07315 [Pseudomonadota bacterium]